MVLFAHGHSTAGSTAGQGRDLRDQWGQQDPVFTSVSLYKGCRSGCCINHVIEEVLAFRRPHLHMQATFNLLLLLLWYCPR
jgi:hypothetical protein